MGNDVGRCCTNRETCCPGSNPSGSIYDGKTLWTLEGVQKLPEGACCIPIRTDSDPRDSTSAAVLEIVGTGDRLIEYRKLCGRLFTFGIDGPLPPEPEKVVLEFAASFKRLSVDMYLTTDNQEANDLHLLGRWLIFVDRLVNASYVPSNALQPVRSKSAVRNMFAGGDASLELVGTNDGDNRRFRGIPAAHEGKVNFTGKWKEAYYEGDYEAYLRECGHNFLRIKAMSMINFGIGLMGHHITQDKNRVRSIVLTPRGSFVNEWTIDGTMHRLKFPGGSERCISARWVDDGMAVQIKEYHENGSVFMITKRYLRQRKTQEMVFEISKPAGKCRVLRIYIREDPEEDDPTAAGLPASSGSPSAN